MNSSFAKVLLLIISASVAVNIPRFFETTIEIREPTDSEKRNNSTLNFPLDFEDFSYIYEVTPLRTDPDYIWYMKNISKHFVTTNSLMHLKF